MNRASKIIAVTLVTAFLFILACFPASAASYVTGPYLDDPAMVPPLSQDNFDDYICIFFPEGVADSVYMGKYYIFSYVDYLRVGYYIENNTVHYYFEFNSGVNDNIVFLSSTLVSWASDSKLNTSMKTLSCSLDTTLMAYGGYYEFYTCPVDEMIVGKSLAVYDTYVINDTFWVDDFADNVNYNWRPTASGRLHNYPVPLITDNKTFFGYEDEINDNKLMNILENNNKIMVEGFSRVDAAIGEAADRVEGAITNAANQIQQAITNAAGEIINAGSDMPTLDTNNDWMNDSLTKVNEWVSQLEAFEQQMNAAQEENSSNMAQAKTFLNGFFEVVPGGVIAALTLFLVMIVVVKVVGR